jgi:hypothetical protein
MDLLCEVNWRGVGVHWIGTSVWHSQQCLRKETKGPYQICSCISDSLLAYGLKIPPAINHELHYNSIEYSYVEISLVKANKYWRSQVEFPPLFHKSFFRFGQNSIHEVSTTVYLVAVISTKNGLIASNNLQLYHGHHSELDRSSCKLFF